jgi:hypothetical protein
MSVIAVSRFDEDESEILTQLEEIYQVSASIGLVLWRYLTPLLNLFFLILAITETG